MTEGGLPPRILRLICEASAWCSHEPFRSAELDPTRILNIAPFPHDLESIKKWMDEKRNSYSRAIPWINQTRSELLKGRHIAPTETSDTLARSKLLIYDPMETVSDGAAEVSSTGFYNVDDAPPWDTWFLYMNGSVFCIVPDFAIARAQSGIAANPVDCVRWADWSSLAGIGE